MCLKKTDIHLHLSLDKIPVNGVMSVSSAEEMIPHLDELSIGKGILMSTGEKKTKAMPFGTNEDNKIIASKFPERYSWMCNIDPVDEDNIYERLENYKSQGAVGIGEFMINRRLDDEFIQKVFKAAEKLDMPILFHMSPKEGYSYGVVDEPGLPLLEESLRKYPKLKFIGHSQVFWHEMSGDAGTELEERIKWGEGEVKPGGRIEYLFDKYPNLYGDLSANSGGCALMRDEKYGIRFIEKFHKRLMFGTDMVNTDMEFPLGKWLDEKLKSGDISEEAYENICFKNAKKIFLIRSNEEGAYE